ILELNKPVIIVLNMMDIALQRGIKIDIHSLEQQLGCTVLPIQAHKKIGLRALHEAISHLPPATKALDLKLSQEIEDALAAIEQQLQNTNIVPSLISYYAHRLI